MHESRVPSSPSTERHAVQCVKDKFKAVATPPSLGLTGTEATPTLLVVLDTAQQALRQHLVHGVTDTEDTPILSDKHLRHTSLSE